MAESVLVTNVQRFSLHDGPGIRTTVFCKGCSLRCPWCANPENLVPRPEPYIKDGQTGTYGRYMTCEELFNEVMKDKIFYDQKEQAGVLVGVPGGVTFSGGEPLLQIKALAPLLAQLKENGVHLCVETALFVPEEALVCALPYIDLFYVDVKILDAAQCKHTLGGSLEQYEANVAALFAAAKPVVFRVPVIGGYTDGETNRQAVAEFIKRWRPMKVELIKEHHLGESKYISLGRAPPPRGHDVPEKLLAQLQQNIEMITGIETEVCSI